MQDQGAKLPRTSSAPSSPKRGEEELTLVRGRLAKRRRGRRRTITTLPDHVREQLVQAFANVDIEGRGRVNRFKLVEVVKQAYHPTEQEVAHVCQFLGVADPATEVEFEWFRRIFSMTTEPLWAGNNQLSWAPLRAMFDTILTQVARHGRPPTELQLERSGNSLEGTFDEEILHLHQSIQSVGLARESSFICELTRQAFVLPPKKVEQLLVFFGTTSDDTVELAQFIHGMTLLYGDMQLLLTTQPEPRSPKLHPLDVRLDSRQHPSGGPGASPGSPGSGASRQQVLRTTSPSAAAKLSSTSNSPSSPSMSRPPSIPELAVL